MAFGTFFRQNGLARDASCVHSCRVKPGLGNSGGILRASWVAPLAVTNESWASASSHRWTFFLLFVHYHFSFVFSALSARASHSQRARLPDRNDCMETFSFSSFSSFIAVLALVGPAASTPRHGAEAARVQR